MSEVEREILQKVNYLVDLFHDAAIYKARYEKERQLRGKLQNAGSEVLNVVLKWSIPPDDVRGCELYDVFLKILQEAKETP